MSKQVLPYDNVRTPKKEQVAQMFDGIAWRYDFLNHFLSLGIDRYWRRRALKLIKNSPQLILDVATGTADFAIEAVRLDPDKIIGIDISKQMLKIGKEKVQTKHLDNIIELEEGEVEELRFDDNTFDAIIVAFGMRNFGDIEKGLLEMHRVLKHGKELIVLEFSSPKGWLLRSVYQFYFHRILPVIGRLVSKEKSAYTYLPRSVKAFPEGKELLNKFESAGYKVFNCIPLTLGICTIYQCEKS